MCADRPGKALWAAGYGVAGGLAFGAPRGQGAVPAPGIPDRFPRVQARHLVRADHSRSFVVSVCPGFVVVPSGGGMPFPRQPPLRIVMAAFGQNNAASVRHRPVADTALRVPGHQVQAVAVTVAVFPAAYAGMNVALAVNPVDAPQASVPADRKSTRLNSSH